MINSPGCCRPFEWITPRDPHRLLPHQDAFGQIRNGTSDNPLVRHQRGSYRVYLFAAENEEVHFMHVGLARKRGPTAMGASLVGMGQVGHFHRLKHKARDNLALPREGRACCRVGPECRADIAEARLRDAVRRGDL